MNIITHRGLDPSRKNFFAESSLEAFEDHLKRGFGIEFDIQFTKDNGIAIWHDENLARLTGGKDQRKIESMTITEWLTLHNGECRTADFPMLLDLHEKYPNAIYAIHLKSYWQKPVYIENLLNALSKTEIYDNFFIFDVKIPVAKFIKKRNKNIRLAPSVAHPFDIKRFNRAVGGTLKTINEALAHRKLYDWAWLDEWNREDEVGSKTLYTEKNIKILRKENFKIAVVSPELHAISPGLIGGEAHSDAVDYERLEKRWKEILTFHPDAICTDYPDSIKNLTI